VPEFELVDVVGVREFVDLREEGIRILNYFLICSFSTIVTTSARSIFFRRTATHSHTHTFTQFQMSKPSAANASVIRLKPYHYIHVLDNNTNVTRVEVGPQTFTRKDHETIVAGPEQMIMIPPRHYCVIANPVVRYQSKPQSQTIFLSFSSSFPDVNFPFLSLHIYN
jgi:GTPase SAR1 family protein